MTDYKTYGHAKTRLRYHVIFSTKYRRKCLSGIEDSVRAVFSHVEDVSDFRIHALGVDKDHIHIGVSFKPNWSLSQIVRRLKQMSPHLLWESEGDHLRKFYHEDKHRLWTGGYFAETVGRVSESRALEYVRNQ